MAWMVYDYPDPPGRREDTPLCPVCGGECGSVFRDGDYEIVGCDLCLTEHDAYETDECFRYGRSRGEEE